MKFLKYFAFDTIHRETVEAWVKILDDITKAALIAVLPLFMIMSSYSIYERFISAATLAVICYLCQLHADKLRKYREKLN